jgi:hypothetical protein
MGITQHWKVHALKPGLQQIVDHNKCNPIALLTKKLCTQLNENSWFVPNCGEFLPVFETSFSKYPMEMA